MAVVGLPDFGLLAAAEMGADLSRLAVIPDPGTDPVEVAAVLMDGMDLVVLGLAGRTVTATRARAVVARARQKGCTLLVTGGRLAGRLDADGRPGVRLRDDREPGRCPGGRAAAGSAGAVVGPGAGPATSRPADVTARVLAIWCMDWPAVAAAAAAGLPATTPVAVTLANRVIACSAAARAAGVRRGLRRRESQARCPQLHVATADPARDARFFEGVTAAVDDVVPRAEVLRPGLLVLSVRGAARYFGSEQAAAERLVDAVAAAGAECQVGIADQMPTAVFAARAGRVVEPGADAAFLSGAVDPAAGHRAEPVRTRPCGAGRSVVAHGYSHSRPVRRRCPAAMWPPGSVPTRWPRTASPAASRCAGRRAGSRRRNSTPC